jgi:hypothetical protein
MARGLGAAEQVRAALETLFAGQPDLQALCVEDPQSERLTFAPPSLPDRIEGVAPAPVSRLQTQGQHKAPSAAASRG